MVLIDSTRKKTLFLKEVAHELGIHVDIITKRMEEYIQTTAIKFDATVNRAVDTLATMWASSDLILKENGVMYAMKGGDCKKEISDLAYFNVNYNLIEPDSKWIKLSPIIANKFIIKVERKNEKK
jgi:16S rRNA G527 N7-methylase RsmG